MICHGCKREDKQMMAEGTAQVSLCFDCYCLLRERSRLYQKQIELLTPESVHRRIQGIMTRDRKRN